ncbi:MAG: helix-turn-helix transcriptional regulator, partial [Vicinamibacterales bacterium]
MPSKRELLQVLREVRRRHDAGLTLEQLAERAGWSPFDLHRTFSEMVGETPKGYSLRLRLERAAARLVSTRDSVLDIALATGFRSHEVFTRAYRRQFGQTPASYRTA